MNNNIIVGKLFLLNNYCNLNLTNLNSILLIILKGGKLFLLNNHYNLI